MESPSLKKRFGQHHLREPALCRPAVDYLDPAGAEVIEIGVGGGVLTRALLAAGARVRAWELDPTWAFAAAASLRDHDRIDLVVGDALEIPWNRVGHRVGRQFMVAGNLPYNVATPIIDRVLDAGPALVRAAFLVQLEVAERLTAAPGSKTYGALSVLTQARCVPSILGRVRPGSFNPPPKVDSAFVGFEPHPTRLGAERLEALRSLVHAAFGQRRKTLRNALSVRWPRERVAAALDRLGLPAEVRAERLSLEDFDALLNLLQSV